MMTWLRIAAASALLGAVQPASAQPLARSDTAATIEAVVRDHGPSGFVMVADAVSVIWQTPRASCPPAGTVRNAAATIALCHPRDPAQMRWPWASITKQVLATLAMQEAARGRIVLDEPADRYLPALAGTVPPTVRQLIQHRAGLRNPEDTAKDASGQPGWYTTGPTGLDWCLVERRAAGGDWRYNNCDTIVLGALLAKVTGKDVPTLFADSIARPADLTDTAFAPVAAGTLAVSLTPDERSTLARYGAAGGLIGTPADLLRFDRALMAGALLPDAARAEMWRGDPALGYMALGQWAFEVPLKGCAKPVRLIERRGGIGRFQARNIIAPDHNLIFIAFTADGEYDFGEIWQGKGFSHDLLAAAVCA